MVSSKLLLDPHTFYWESPRDRLPHVHVAECVSPSNTLMLPSTINTGSYIIEKYSRSNPSHVSAPTQSQGLSTGPPEWEHFAHPNMSLTLDGKRSMNSTYESVRLRIIWSNVNKGRDGTLGEAIMVRTRKAHICTFLTQRSVAGRPRSLVLF